MKEFSSTNDILEFAIKAEQEAVDFYTGLSEKSRNAHMKQVFNDFAREEMSHKAKLTGIKDSGNFELSAEKISDLKISEYLVDVAPTAEMNYSDALILAMKKEKNAFRLYTRLSEQTNDPVMKNLFMALAQEESKHKLRFEVEYDEYILKEN